MKNIIKTHKAPAPIGPYNQAVEINGLIFISGQIALNPHTGELMNSDIETETKYVFENIRGILGKAGLDFSHVIKVSVFVSNMNMYNRINSVYAKYFDAETAPARELVEVAGLPKAANIEISVIAYKS